MDGLRTKSQGRITEIVGFSEISFTYYTIGESGEETSFTITEYEPTFTRTFKPKILISASAECSQVKQLRTKVTVNRADCIRKRIKTHFNQYLLKLVNKHISKKFPRLTIAKLSQQFIADVKIESNKNYINLPIKKVFTEKFPGSESHKTNQHSIDSILQSGEEELKQLLELPYGHFFNLYLKSDTYQNDIRKFSRKEGENYSNLFIKYSAELIDYYANGVPYKRKRLSTFESF